MKIAIPFHPYWCPTQQYDHESEKKDGLIYYFSEPSPRTSKRVDGWELVRRRRMLSHSYVFRNIYCVLVYHTSASAWTHINFINLKISLDWLLSLICLHKKGFKVTCVPRYFNSGFVVSNITSNNKRSCSILNHSTWLPLSLALSFHDIWRTRPLEELVTVIVHLQLCWNIHWDLTPRFQLFKY